MSTSPAPLPGGALALATLAATAGGLVAAGVAAGALRAGPPGRGVGAVLAVVAVTLVAWGLTSLARGRLLAPLGAASALATAAAAWLVAVGQGLDAAAGLGADDAALVALVWLAALGAAAHRRRAPGRPSRPRAVAASWVLAALVSAGLATPGLAATPAGEHAVPHGGHGTSTAPPTRPAPAVDAPAGHAGH